MITVHDDRLLTKFGIMHEAYHLPADVMFNFLRQEEGVIHVLVMPPLSDIIYIPFVYEDTDVIIKEYKNVGI